MEYDELKVIDEQGRYILLCPNVVEPMRMWQQVGIFDLKKRIFVLDPYNLGDSKVEKINDKAFKVTNSQGRHYTTLYLPGEYKGKYFSNAHFVPHFLDSEISVDEFLTRSQDICLDIDGQYWKMMRKENPCVYKLVVQIYDLAAEECSPINDLNYARAIRMIIDSNYNGNINEALQDIINLSKMLTYSSSQSAVNMWTDYLRLISSIRISLAYDSMMSTWSDNEWIFKEYIAWHNLIEGIKNYLDYLYEWKMYSSVPEEKNYKVIGWLDYRRKCLEKERDILSGKLVYSIEQTRADSIRNYADFEAFFSHFHMYTVPYYYHAMWNEVKFAFDEWIFARTKVAEGLGELVASSYKEYSKEVIDGIFSAIEELDWPYFRPALSE